MSRIKERPPELIVGQSRAVVSARSDHDGKPHPALTVLCSLRPLQAPLRDRAANTETAAESD